jgi:ubiquinone/menaquinone biosynthesis C-methylase UbiE
MSNRNSRQVPPDIDVGEIKTFYDTIYHANAPMQEGKTSRHYRRLFRRLAIKKGSTALDVACGTGGWLKVCQDNGVKISGIDLSDNAIATCKKLLPDGIFHAQPAETLPFSDGQFDVVTCLGSLEHFVDPVSSLKEMVRVAKRNAIFVILVPNKDFLTRKLGLFSGTYQVDAKEVVRTLEEWESLFLSAGLTVTERWKDLHVINLSWILNGRFYMWPLRLMQGLLLTVWPLRWQYQVYHRCLVLDHVTIGDLSVDTHSQG